MYVGLFCICAAVAFIVTLQILNAAGVPLDLVAVYLALAASVLLGGLITSTVMANYFSDDR